MAEEFRYVTTNLYQNGVTGNPIIAELPLTEVNYTSQLNSVGTFTGHLLLSGANSATYNAYEGTVPGKTILWVLYTNPTTNETKPVWSGVIWAREYDGASQTLSLSAQEMMSLYNRRRISTTKDYSNNPSDPLGYDPIYIAQQLMAYAEALPHGKTGLDTSIGIGVSAYRTKKVYEGYELKSVYQAVKDLAANFFDFAIKPEIAGNTLENVLYLQYPLGNEYVSSNPYEKVFSYPGNLVGYSYPEDASSAANKLYGLGYGDNNSKIVAKAVAPERIGSYTITNASGNGTKVTYTASNRFVVGQEVVISGVVPSQYNGTFTVTAADPSGTLPHTSFKVASIATGTYTSGGTANSTWPLLEDTASYTDIGDLQLLKDLTLGQLNATSYPPAVIQIVIPTYIDPVYTSYNIGDQIRLDVKDDYFYSGLNGEILRIIAISVAPGENGPSRVTLTLSKLLAAGEVS